MMKNLDKIARVFKLTPSANAAVIEVAETTTRNLSNSASYLITLGYEHHKKQQKLASTNIIQGNV